MAWDTVTSPRGHPLHLLFRLTQRFVRIRWTVFYNYIIICLACCIVFFSVFFCLYTCFVFALLFSLVICRHCGFILFYVFIPLLELRDSHMLFIWYVIVFVFTNWYLISLMTHCLYLLIYFLGGGVVYKPSFILFPCINVYKMTL